MHTFGGYQIGLALLIDRGVLLQQLEALEAGAEFAIEQGRKQRLLDSLERVRKHRAAAAVRISVASDAEEWSIARLPAGIVLQPDNLRVDFRGAADLLAKLYELSQAVGNDLKRSRPSSNGRPHQRSCLLTDMVDVQLRLLFERREEKQPSGFDSYGSCLTTPVR